MVSRTSISLLFATVVVLSSCSDTRPEIHYPKTKFFPGQAELFIGTDTTEHSAVTFSPNGGVALWSIIKPGGWRAAILEMDYVDGKWSAPYVPSFVDSTAS